MTQEDFGLVLSALLEAREEIQQSANVLRCDRILYGWLGLGVRVWGYVSRTDFNDHTRFYFNDASWMFDKRGKMIRYTFVEITNSEIWTRELVKKLKEHYERAKASGQTIEGTLNTIEILGIGRHPIPVSDEDMLQQIVEAEED